MQVIVSQYMRHEGKKVGYFRTNIYCHFVGFCLILEKNLYSSVVLFHLLVFYFTYVFDTHPFWLLHSTR